MGVRSRVTADAYVGGIITNTVTGAAPISRGEGTRASQTTNSSSNPHWRRKVAMGRDAGSAFYSWKPEVEILKGWTGTSIAKQGGEVYTGGFAPAWLTFVPILSMPDTLRNELLVDGTTAVARSSPTNPVADATVALGELRFSGLPKVPGAELRATGYTDQRKFGSEYINLMFGIQPLVSDLQSFTKAAMGSEKILAQLERDSGRNVRRRFDFPTVKTKSVVSETGHWPRPVVSTWHYKGSYTRTITTEVTTRKWFSGAFTYHLGNPNRVFGAVRKDALRAKKLYGVRLTPEVLWNLAPWSWAADYVGNMGDVITNLSNVANDGLVMRYGYSMQEIVKTTTVELRGPGLWSGGAEYLATKYTTTQKSRVRATPFGFGLNSDGFSPRQWSIIAALGIANAPGKSIL